MPRTFALPLLSLLTLLGLVLGAAPAQAAPKKLPAVDMTAVTAAAQVEGYRGNQPGLGDDPSTRLVQLALTAKGFRVTADGHFSRATAAAYTRYQKSLGYKGVDANGIPGPQSLTRLGQGRFVVTRVVQIGSRDDRYGTKRVNTRTKLMLAAADAKLPFAITVSQGSYCILTQAGCARASAGTHDAGGAVDVNVRGLTTTQRWQAVQAMRSVGFAAWYRPSSQCSCWSAHIHAIAIGDTDLWQKDGKTTNRDQVADYYVGRNGLSGHALDNTPTRYRAPFTTWERYAGI
ncbi:peptidoglycan-binding protein [Microlunatus lacustris]